MNAPWIDAMAHGAISLAGAAMLVLAIGSLLARRVAVAVGVVAAQAAGLVLVLLATAWLQAGWGLLVVAGFSLVAKVVALPLGLRPLAPALAEAPRRGVVAPAAAVALAGLALVMVAPVAGPELAMALAVTSVGGLAAAWRPDPAGQAVGVLALENGLVLALATTGMLAAAPPLALATAALPGAVLMLLVRRLLARRAPV